MSTAAFLFYDIYGNSIKNPIQIGLESLSLGDRRKFFYNKTIPIQLHDFPHDSYKMITRCVGYLPVQRFIKSELISIILPFDYNKISKITWREPKLFEEKSDILTAARANIIAKCKLTRFGNQKTVCDYIIDIQEVKPDRVYAIIDLDIINALTNELMVGSWRQVPASLHQKDSRKGYLSFKTNDTYGNLQVTFFKDSNIADIDIDDYNGFRHLFQVARNFASGAPSHPYNIHQILRVHQNLDTGYILEV